MACVLDGRRHRGEASAFSATDIRCCCVTAPSQRRVREQQIIGAHPEGFIEEDELAAAIAKADDVFNEVAYGKQRGFEGVCVWCWRETVR